MDNLLKSELFKLRKNRSFWTLFMIIAVAGASYAPLVYFVFDVQSVSIKELLASVALYSGNNYIVKFAPCILAGFFISDEYSMGTMKSMGASGNSRIRIYFAKLLVFSLGATVIALTLPIIMPSVGILFFGMHDIPDLGYIIQTFGFTILYAFAFASIMALVAILFTDSGKTIAVLILFFSLFDSIMYMLAQKFKVMDTIYSYSVSKLFLDISQFNMGKEHLLKLLIVPIFTFILFGWIGSFVFQRKEIK